MYDSLRFSIQTSNFDIIVMYSSHGPVMEIITQSSIGGKLINSNERLLRTCNSLFYRQHPEPLESRRSAPEDNNRIRNPKILVRTARPVSTKYLKILLHFHASWRLERTIWSLLKHAEYVIWRQTQMCFFLFCSR